MTRRGRTIHRLFGPPGSARRRRLRALPAIGVVLRGTVGAYRNARAAWLSRQRRVVEACTDFKNRHTRTAGNLTRKNTRRAYERVYGDDRLLGEYLAPERLAFYREVAELAAGFGPRSVVDVGCGPGNLLHELVARAELERVVGVDHASAAVRRAAELVPGGEFHTTSLYDVDLAETFDVVLCTEVLEHVRDPATAVERLLRLCDGAGAVVITVPDGTADTWEGHLNFWTEPELEDFLGGYGDVEVTKLGDDLLAVLRPGRELRPD